MKTIYRNKKIARYINENLDCCITGEPGPDPHHIKGEGFGTCKAPDYMQIPLNHFLHNELHDLGYREFEKKYNVTQRALVLHTVPLLLAVGLLKLDDINEQWIKEGLK